MAACEQFTADEVERATFALVRSKTRPHIGDVYDALDKAKAAAPPAQSARSSDDDSDFQLLVAWLTASKIRYYDFQAEFGAPERGADPLVPESRLRDYVFEKTWKLSGRLHQLMTMAFESRDKINDPFNRKLVYALRHAAQHGTDREGFQRRVVEFSKIAA